MIDKRLFRRAALLLPALALLGAHLAAAPRAFSQGEILVGAGDIASCGTEGDELTANLLDNIPGIVFTAGDTVQGDGTPEYWAECYAPNWGRHRDRTRPALGNHEYQRVQKPDAYFDFFGEERAGPRDKGWYSYNAGGWHIIVLNSIMPAHPGTEQYEWLLADLAAHPVPCVLAIWHHPMFSSGAYGVARRMGHVWRALYAAGADVIVNGDAHHYERFALMDPQANLDPEHGIRQFIVGTGGGALTPLGRAWRATEARQNEAWGVLKLTLAPGGYSWEFVPVAGRTWTDSGSAACVGPRPQ
jgi:hypothetical protein